MLVEKARFDQRTVLMAVFGLAQAAAICGAAIMSVQGMLHFNSSFRVSRPVQHRWVMTMLQDEWTAWQVQPGDSKRIVLVPG